MTFHPHRYKPKAPKANKFRNPFSKVPSLGDMAMGSGGWPAGYGPGTSKKLTKQYHKGGSNSGIRQGRVMNEGTGGQYSMYTGPKGKSFLPKHVENALAPQVIQAVNASQLKSTQGLQNFSTPLELFQPSICTTFTGDKISRVLYEKASGDVTINNILLSNAYIIIYDIMARKDLATGSAVGSPSAAWTQGDTDTGGATTSPTFLGSTPWQSEAFNQFFDVKQVTNIVLCAGGTHVHKVRLSPRKVISSAYAQYSGAQFGRISYYTMVEIHGSPANDTTTQTQVSIGAGAVNIIADSEQRIKQLQRQTPQIFNSNGLVTFSVGEQVVNIGGSTIVAQAEG